MTGLGAGLRERRIARIIPNSIQWHALATPHNHAPSATRKENASSTAVNGSEERATNAKQHSRTGAPQCETGQTDTRSRTETYARSNSSGSGSPLIAPAASRTSAAAQITGAHGPRPIPLRSRVTAEPPPAPPPLPRSRPASRGETHERLNAARLPSPARRAARRGSGSSSVARGSGGGLGFWRARGFLAASARGNEWKSEPSGDETTRSHGGRRFRGVNSDASGEPRFRI
jgi:hypothetical protein